MKKYILSGLAGAGMMLAVLSLFSFIRKNTEGQPEEYQHINYVSAITSDECYVCSEQGLHWGEDNVGIINLNTFKLLHISINRYDNHGELIKEPGGVMVAGSLYDHDSESYVNANVLPDNAYAQVALSGVKYDIDREIIQSRLCQTCLDTINDLWFTTQPPAEYAIISFEDKTIQPLVNSILWLASGNYGVDCEFKADGAIDLLIHYCPFRYEYPYT